MRPLRFAPAEPGTRSSPNGRAFSARPFQLRAVLGLMPRGRLSESASGSASASDGWAVPEVGPPVGEGLARLEGKRR
jgi:hypothetical protein